MRRRRRRTLVREPVQAMRWVTPARLSHATSRSGYRWDAILRCRRCGVGPKNSEIWTRLCCRSLYRRPFQSPGKLQ
jgi:hypothetical protein